MATNQFSQIEALELALAKLLGLAESLDSMVMNEYGGEAEDLSEFKNLIPDYAEYEHYVIGFDYQVSTIIHPPGKYPPRNYALDFGAWRKTDPRPDGEAGHQAHAARLAITTQEMNERRQSQNPPPPVQDGIHSTLGAYGTNYGKRAGIDDGC